MALTTYFANYRLASRPYGLSWASGGAATKQFATIGHAATATKLVRLRHVWVAVESASAAAIVHAELVRLTDNAQATGNPAVTPAILRGGTVAAESTCLALPTTPGAEGAMVGFAEWNSGITAAAPTTNPPPSLLWIDLLTRGGSFQPVSRPDFENDERLPTIRPLNAEGWAVRFDAGASATVVGLVGIEFSEE